MNFFQEQLKAIFTSSKFSEDVQYIGRAAYIPLTYIVLNILKSNTKCFVFFNIQIYRKVIV